MDGWAQFDENGVLWFMGMTSGSTSVPISSVFMVPNSEITYLREFEYRDEQALRDIAELERIFQLTDERES